MKALNASLVVVLFALLVTPAHAEECQTGWEDAAGAPQNRAINIDFASLARLDRAVLPEGTSGIACRRASIVPMPDDIRVLIEWGVSFGLLVEDGRSLWIWSRGGRLQSTVDNGELSAAESDGVNGWLEVAQARFDAALAARR